MLKYNFGFLLILVFLIPACTSVKEKDLYGTYVAEYSFGIEKLTLDANGDYIQEVTIKAQTKMLTHRGHWRYAPEDKYVELEKALDIQDPLGNLKKDYDVPFNGLVLCKVKRFSPWSRIKLSTASERVNYLKIIEKKEDQKKEKE